MVKIDKNSWNALQNVIKDANTILLSTHVNPDGDGLGSEIAFYYYLLDLGKDCRIINISPLPFNYKIIDPDNVIEEYNSDIDKWLKGVDLAIVFDIGDFKRTGKIGEIVKSSSKLVCIDHHPPKDDHPFEINIVDVDAPATGYLIWKYFEYINYSKEDKFPLKIANGLYTSLVTDTGSFKYQSTTSDTHIMAADLLKSGVNGYDIQRSIYEQQPISQIRLLGLALSNLNFSKNGKVVWIIINDKMLEQANATEDDAGGFTEYLRMIENVEVSYMLRYVNNNHRVNFRSSGNIVINDIAQFFGGGGHKYAAGARVIDMNTDDIIKNINNLLGKKILGEFNVD